MLLMLLSIFLLRTVPSSNWNGRICCLPGFRARKNMCFTVIHFAGPVSYDGTSFMDWEIVRKTGRDRCIFEMVWMTKKIGASNSCPESPPHPKKKNILIKELQPWKRINGCSPEKWWLVQMIHNSSFWRWFLFRVDIRSGLRGDVLEMIWIVRMYVCVWPFQQQWWGWSSQILGKYNDDKCQIDMAMCC